MLPILKFGNLAIPTYGVIGLFAFLFTLWLIKYYAVKEDFDYRQARDMYLYAVAASLIGAKLLGIIIEMPTIIQNPGHLWKTLITGGVYYGGLLAAILIIVIYSHYQKINLFLFFDMLFPIAALVIAIARWGCFASGCCFGKPTTVPWAVTFTNEIAHKMHPNLPHVPIHPTQIYLSLNSLIIFIILTYLYKHKRFHGQIFLSYFVLYGIGRFFIEYYRFDYRGIMLGGYLSTSQLAALVTSILSLIGLLYFYRKAKKRAKSQQ